MSTRIGHLASSQQLINLMMRTQKRMLDTQVQITSEKVSQDYQGLATTAERLVNIENQVTLLKQFNANNELMDLDLETIETTLVGIQDSISNFREELVKFQSGDLTDQTRIEIVQDAAFLGLLSIETFLNTDVGGKFIFSGSRTDTIPVDLGLTTLTAFQAKWTGSTTLATGTTYPIREDSNIYMKLTAAAGHPTDTGTPTTTGYGTLTFTAGAGGTITAATAGAFANLPVGSQITISGNASSTNNGTFTVAANTGTVITVGVSDTLAADGPAAVSTLVANTSYYSGDSNSTVHKVAKGRELTYDINAIDPAFEKTIRAMSIIAQGAFGTAGGLDQTANQSRVDDAYYLLSSAFDSSSTGTAPYATEKTSNISALSMDNYYDRVLIDLTKTSNLQMIGFLEQRVADVENVDPLEAITRMLDDQRALEASYQAMARARSLSLNNFL